MFNYVVSFDTVLNENVMAFGSETDVPSNIQEMNTMQSQYSCHRVMNRITNRIWFWNISSHVEMVTISSDDLWLTTFGKLSVSDFTDQTILSASCQH